MDYNLKNLKLEKNYLDIGTGDGRYVFKSAQKNPDFLYIGIDPAPNLKEYQREINRKKLSNAVLINSSIENFSPDIANFFNQITIILPWGNLLKYVVTVDSQFFLKLNKWLKDLGEVEIIFGFGEELEEKETKRLNLPDLTEKEISYIKDKYEALENYKLKEFVQVPFQSLGSFEATWAKKLSFGKNRKYLLIRLEKC